MRRTASAKRGQAQTVPRLGRASVRRIRAPVRRLHSQPGVRGLARTQQDLRDSARCGRGTRWRPPRHRREWRRLPVFCRPIRRHRRTGSRGRLAVKGISRLAPGRTGAPTVIARTRRRSSILPSVGTQRSGKRAPRAPRASALRGIDLRHPLPLDCNYRTAVSDVAPRRPSHEGQLQARSRPRSSLGTAYSAPQERESTRLRWV